jgi:hypothetical protein
MKGMNDMADVGKEVTAALQQHAYSHHTFFLFCEWTKYN